MKRIKIVVAVCSIALASLITVQYISIKTTLKYNRNNHAITLISKKAGQVHAVINLLLDVETGVRGYLLTGSQEFLEPYEFALKKLPIEIEKLYISLSSEEKAALGPLVKSRIDIAQATIEKKKSNKIIPLSDLEAGKNIMDKIRFIANEILSRDEAIGRASDLGLSKEVIASKLIAGSFFSLLLVGFCLFYFLSEFIKRLKTEKELQISLATSEAISRDIDFGIIACDSFGNIIFTNKWISKRMPSLKKIEDFFISNESLKSLILQLLHGEIESIEEAELTIDGHPKIFTVNSSPFHINEQLKGVVFSIIDTTDSAQRMASLITGKQMADFASKAKSDFLAKMSHEIRTPLNAILGVGEILSLSKLDSEQSKCLEIFKRSAITLNNLVNDILDISKIEAGKIDIIEAPFSLKSLIYSCTSIMDFRASQRGLLFSTSVDSHYDHFIGDEGRLRQIILNLLSNAIKFTEKGEVSFAIKCFDKGEKKELIFTIRDSGRGISPENIGKLFSDYQQENSSITQEFGGTGLGLSLSRELARLMNSDVSVQSELGVGSEFTFRITLAVAEGEFIEDITDAKLIFNKLKILLVDDNQENRFIVKKYLSDFDIEIIEASDGEEAITKFKEDVYDLVFMDINMPKKDGILATSELRKYEIDNGLDKTLIIALSANALSLEYTRAMAAGCDDYLTKPISRLKLIYVIKKWVGGNNIPTVTEVEINDLLNDNNDEEIDLDIKALIPTYLESRLKDLETIKEAFAKNEIPIIAKLVHNIKGTAISYGQNNLDILAKAIEVAIKDNDMNEVESLIHKMDILLRVKDGN
jgi:signal transduction histidine kinase/DNA-binding response OmpR family regulator/CHASE3 domain sensor protein